MVMNGVSRHGRSCNLGDIKLEYNNRPAWHGVSWLCGHALKSWLIFGTIVKKNSLSDVNL